MGSRGGYHTPLPHSFERQLQLLCPGMKPKEAMLYLLSRHGSLNKMAKVEEIGASLTTLAKWGRRFGLSPLPPFAHVRVIRAILLTDTMGKIGERVNKLKEEEGTWAKVAVKLRVTYVELKRYRVSIGIVPKNKWRQRVEGAGIIGLISDQENYYGY